MCRVAAPTGRIDFEEAVEDFNERLVFQAWDMICGRLFPELGGSPRHLDIVGINYYWTNQWEWGAPANADGIVPPLARRGSATSIVAGACAYRVAPIRIRGHDFGDGAHW